MASHIKTELIVGEHSGISLQIPPPPPQIPYPKQTKQFWDHENLGGTHFHLGFWADNHSPHPHPILTHTLS